MAFKKGNDYGGRQSGAKNKFTKQFKDLLTETYQALEKKEGYGLQVWAEKHPNDFYRICAKLVPQEITGADGGALVEVQIYTLPDGTKVKF